MANRFWVGGPGNWDASTTTHWSAATGGAGGASVPTNVDSVFVDANSGSSPTITVTATANCLDITFTGAITPTLTGTSPITLNVFGSLVFIASMTVSGSLTILMASLVTGKTVTTTGLSMTLQAFTFDGVGGGWTLQDNLNLVGILSVKNGTIDTNSKTITCLSINHSSGTCTLTLGSSVINNSGNFVSTSTAGLTLNAGTSTINFTGANSSLVGTGHTFYNVNFTGAAGSIATSNTFNVLTVAANCTLSLTAGITQTVTNFVSNGSAGNLAILKSATGASPATISKSSGTINVSYISLQDITATGGAAFNAFNSTNVSGNTGINFTNTLYWIGRTGNWSNTANWSGTTGGVSAGIIPSSVINAAFDANSFNAASQVVTVDVTANCLDMVWTGATNSPTLAGSSALNVYGSLTLIAAMAITYTGTITFSSTSTGKTITMNSKTLASQVIFSGVGGWTLQDAFNNGISNTITLTNGSLNTNGQTVTTGTFNSSNSNTRTLTLGSSIINVSLNWTFTTVTSLTFSGASSTINMTGNTTTFAGGGLTYNIVNLTGTPITIAGSNTFTTFTISAGKTVSITAGTTQTVTNLTANGLASQITIQSTSAGTPYTISKASGAARILNVSLKDSTGNGGAVFNAFGGSLNVSGNTGWVFTKLIGQIKMDTNYSALFWTNQSGVITKISG